MVRDASSHSGRLVNAPGLLGQRLMLPAKVVVHAMQAHRVLVVLDLLHRLRRDSLSRWRHSDDTDVGLAVVR